MTDRPHSLTRAAIEAGAVEQMMLNCGVPVRVLSEAERAASLAGTLADHPAAGGDVWLFAYGSLIWNPTIAFAERRTGTIRGWHRRFCLSSPVGRGTPEQPGLMLGLDRGGSCRGVAYRVPAEAARDELTVVWRREMVTGAYQPRWVRVAVAEREVPAIAFVVNRAGPNYVGAMPREHVVERLAVAAGRLGSSADYLFETAKALALAAVPDPHLERLAAAVRAAQAARG